MSPDRNVGERVDESAVKNSNTGLIRKKSSILRRSNAFRRYSDNGAVSVRGEKRYRKVLGIRTMRVVCNFRHVLRAKVLMPRFSRMKSVSR